MWSAYLFRTTTGQIGPRLDYETVSWSIELNGIESIQLKLTKADLPKGLDLKYWLSPWWAGVVLLWDDTPVVAGPITTRPNETLRAISVNCGGIRSVLANRVVVRDITVGFDLAKSVIYEGGVSLGTIAKRVVQWAQIKAGGPLPISFPISDQTALDNADHQRTYRGFDLQNLDCDGILTKLSNVIDGPDIMFKPRLIRDNQLTFDMFYGTEDQPRISQSIVPVWDTVPERGEVSDMGVIYTGTYQTSRVYSIGAGQDEGLLITVDQDEAPLRDGFPLLEKVINVGSSEDENIVRSHGRAELSANSEALLEIQMTVRGDGPVFPFGTFWPGDLAHIYVKDWISLPDGLTKMRILSMTGDGTANVKISLQKEDKFV